MYHILAFCNVFNDGKRFYRHQKALVDFPLSQSVKVILTFLPLDGTSETTI